LNDERVLQKLEEIAQWLKLQNRSLVKALLEEVLDSDRDKLIYHLSDGERSSTDIAREVGVSQPTVSNLWRRWRRLGIVLERPDIPGRVRKLCGLEELDIDVLRTF